jgi:hypothetical protein
MAIPHADDLPGVAALRPDKDYESTIEPACRDVARLPVTEARVFAGCHPSRKNFRRVGEVESPLGERPVPFRGVEGNLQVIICNAK